MEIVSIIKHAATISVFVFVMMLLVDSIDTGSKQKLSKWIQEGRWRQYLLASGLGATPGCLGAFMNVSLYVHGVISFGAIVGGMIATSGDEAFVMLVEFPREAMLLFVLLYICGVVFAWLADQLMKSLNFVQCDPCPAATCAQCQTVEQRSEKESGMLNPRRAIINLRSFTLARLTLLLLLAVLLVLIILGVLGPDTWGWKRLIMLTLALFPFYVVTIASEHYIVSHIWEHIIRRHLLRIFLWSFGVLLLVHWGLAVYDLKSVIEHNLLWVLIIGAVIGLIPESGPHLLIVIMFAQGIVPFSVLFTASFVQDGHGMLPMISYSIKDSLLIKLFNLVFGVLVGGILYLLGL
jgi:hypothetical protein